MKSLGTRKLTEFTDNTDIYPTKEDFQEALKTVQIEGIDEELTKLDDI